MVTSYDLLLLTVIASLALQFLSFKFGLMYPTKAMLFPRDSSVIQLDYPLLMSHSRCATSEPYTLRSSTCTRLTVKRCVNEPPDTIPQHPRGYVSSYVTVSIFSDLRHAGPLPDRHDEYAVPTLAMKARNTSLSSQTNSFPAAISSPHVYPYTYAQKHNRPPPCSPELMGVAAFGCCESGFDEGISKYSAGTKSSSFLGAPATATRCK
jgi:hypothetical protein